MSSKLKRLSSLAFATGLMVAPAVWATPPGSVLGNTCAGCHGTNGLSLSPMPRIAGFNEKFLVTTMKNFQSGEQFSTIMGRLAKGYTDEELAGMAKFFAAQKWQSPEQTVDAKLVEQGGKIHAEKCGACHQENGAAMNDTMPRIAGQWLRYLEIVMAAYKDPNRKMPDNALVKMMKMQIKPLKDEDITALAHFYASQK